MTRLSPVAADDVPTLQEGYKKSPQYPHIDGLHAVNTKGTLLGVNHSVIVNVCREEVRTSSLLLISYVLRW